MENFFIGVDGGGTKTIALIQNEAGTIIGEGKAGPGNIKTSPLGSFQSIQTAIQNAFESAHLSHPDHYQLHVGLGMAGTEVPEAKAAFLQIPHPFHSLVLNSDAYVACLGVHGGQDGAILIMGTGVIGFQIEAGQTSRVGGYGFPHSDEGGGAWFGLELLRATFHAYDGRREWTPLLEKAFTHFHRDIHKMTSFANASAAKPASFAEFSPIIMQALEENEPFALDLMHTAASEINQTWDALAKKTTTPLSCCLLGGIAAFIQPYLAHRLKMRLCARKLDPAMGAILMLKQKMGLHT